MHPLNLDFEPFPVITTERLVLRELSQSDLPEIYFLRSDPTVMKYIDRQPAKNEEEAYGFIEMVKDIKQNQSGITWAMSLKNETKLIGTVAIWRIMKEHYRGEIGYTMHPDYQGNGYMREALHAALIYGFNNILLHSVEANINPANEASKNLLLHSGFVKEAHFKENYYYNGVFYDSEIYSLLKSNFSEK